MVNILTPETIHNKSFKCIFLNLDFLLFLNNSFIVMQQCCTYELTDYKVFPIEPHKGLVHTGRGSSAPLCGSRRAAIVSAAALFCARVVNGPRQLHRGSLEEERENSATALNKRSSCIHGKLPQCIWTLQL